MNILFEDNPDMCISRLLSVSYNPTFTGSGVNLKKKKYSDNFRNTIVFVDVVPDNISTKGLYDKLKRLYLVNNNSFVFPIPCIEYFVLNCLDAKNIALEYRYEFMYEIYNQYKTKCGICNSILISGINGDCKTFERLCKYLLNNAQDEFHNVNVESTKYHDDIGKFYMEDSHELTNIDKSMFLWSRLPVCPAADGSKRLSYAELVKYNKEYTLKYMKWMLSEYGVREINYIT